MAKLIVALDGMTCYETIKFAKKLKDTKVIYKVNDLLDDDFGVGIIGKLSEYGEVMDDAKFHDTPNTVKNRIKKHLVYYPSLITVHASGGIDMMKIAVKTASKSNILAVTVLTSLNDEECFLNFGMSIKAKVIQLARDATLAGVYGIVCSPMELKFLSRYTGCLKSTLKNE